MKPRRSKVFYGWWIVGAIFLVALYRSGVIFYGFTAVIEPIAEELGWSYAQISFAASIRGVEIGLLAPLVGILVDRWGPKRLIFGGAVVGSAGLFLLSRATSLPMFYGAFTLLALGTSAYSLTVLMTAVANWFRKNIGIASGIAVSGFGAGGLLVPVMVRLIDVYGWRTTMDILGVGMLVVTIPLSLVFRHKPEQYGYLPDGDVENAALPERGVVLPQAAELNIGVGQALRSGTFWRLTLAVLCHSLVLAATVTHVMPYMSSIGVARSMASMVATAIPLVSIGGRLGCGWLADRLDRKKIAAVTFAMVAFGSLCFGYISSAGIWLLVPFVLLFGVGFGGINVLRPSLTREYFGIMKFGTVFGLITGIGMLGGIIGPPLAGWYYDSLGNYEGIWYVFAGIAVVAAITVLTLTPVRSQPAQASSLEDTRSGRG